MYWGCKISTQTGIDNEQQQDLKCTPTDKTYTLLFAKESDAYGLVGLSLWEALAEIWRILKKVNLE